jgi:Tfp pilus assembly protein, ATPase PilM
MEFAVEAEANQYIPFALDEVNLDFQEIGPAPGSQGDVEVLIAASRKDKVEDRVAVAEAAGLKAVIVDVESLAIESALELVCRQLPRGGADQVIALVDIGASVMNVTMFRNGQSIYSREQAFGGSQLTQDIARQYGMSFEEAESAKRAGSLPDSYPRDHDAALHGQPCARGLACAAVLLHLNLVQPGRSHRARRRVRGHARSR